MIASEPLNGSRSSVPRSDARTRLLAALALAQLVAQHFVSVSSQRRAPIEHRGSATSGRSPIKKIVSPTTGSKVQLTYLGDRAR